MHLTLSVVGKALFGSDVDGECEEIAAEVNSIMRLYNFLVILPKAEHLLDWPIPGLMRFRKARARLRLPQQVVDGGRQSMRVGRWHQQPIDVLTH